MSLNKIPVLAPQSVNHTRFEAVALNVLCKVHKSQKKKKTQKTFWNIIILTDFQKTNITVNFATTVG